MKRFCRRPKAADVIDDGRSVLVGNFLKGRRKWTKVSEHSMQDSQFIFIVVYLDVLIGWVEKMEPTTVQEAENLEFCLAGAK